ncbi:hypothetical protein QT987_06060 [Microcoleus sp. SVA1B4]
MSGRARCPTPTPHKQKIYLLWNRPSSLFMSGRARSPTPTPHKQKIHSLWNRPSSLFLENSAKCSIAHQRTPLHITVHPPSSTLKDLRYSIAPLAPDPIFVSNC